VRKHRLKLFPESFTAKYNCDKLVYYKGFHCIEGALAEELRIKGGSRAKKIELVNSMNETRIDLWDEIKHWRLGMPGKSVFSLGRLLSRKSGTGSRTSQTHESSRISDSTFNPFPFQYEITSTQ